MGFFSRRKKKTGKPAVEIEKKNIPAAPPERKLFDKTVMMYFALFADLAPERAVAVNRDRYGQQKQIAEEHIIDIIRRHYYEELKPPVVWNFNYVILVVPRLTDPEQKAKAQFWDSATGQIADKANYLQICSELRSEWRDGLVELYPDYDRDKLEDGYEKMNFDYYPEEGLLVCTMLLEKLLPLI